MKSKKYIIVLYLLFLTTGCDLTYRINIDENINVEEVVMLSEDYSVILTYTSKPTEYIQKNLDDVKGYDSYKDYAIDTYNSNNNVIGRGTRKYTSLNDYKIGSVFLSEMFKDINISDNDGIISIDMIPVESFPYFEESTIYDSLLNNAYIEISLPYKVINSNADKINNRVYKWEINKEEKLKEINITFDSTKNLDKKIPLSILILSGFILLVATFGLYVYIQYKKNSK